MACGKHSQTTINPNGDKTIIHVHRFAEDIDVSYPVTVAVESDLPLALDAFIAAFAAQPADLFPTDAEIREICATELAARARNDRFPMAPQRIVADIRSALDDDDIVLVDTGAIKMWMARLYPAQKPQRPVDDGILPTRRDCRQAGPSRTPDPGSTGRRFIHDELAGDRNCHSQEDSSGGSGMGR